MRPIQHSLNYLGSLPCGREIQNQQGHHSQSSRTPLHTPCICRPSAIWSKLHEVSSLEEWARLHGKAASILLSLYHQWTAWPQNRGTGRAWVFPVGATEAKYSPRACHVTCLTGCWCTSSSPSPSAQRCHLHSAILAPADLAAEAGRSACTDAASCSAPYPVTQNQPHHCSPHSRQGFQVHAAATPLQLLYPQTCQHPCSCVA